MRKDDASVLDAIGGTSLVRLRKVVPPGCAQIWVKLEWENPTGSKAERLLDEWVFPVCSPALLAKLGPIETLADFVRYPLLRTRAESWTDWLRRVGGDTTRADALPLLEDASATLAAVEQGHGVALARWSLVAADVAAGRLVRPMLPSVQQRSAWFLVAPPEHFSLPKVVRFRAWLVDCCRQFPPPTGETLPAE